MTARPSLTRTAITTTVLFFLMTLSGCLRSNKKPVIPGFHWHGDTLYDTKGMQVASVVDMDFANQPSQACIYEIPGSYEYGCTYWETAQEAYDHIGAEFSKRERGE